jgi:hypothetical protein
MGKGTLVEASLPTGYCRDGCALWPPHRFCADDAAVREIPVGRDSELGLCLGTFVLNQSADFQLPVGDPPNQRRLREDAAVQVGRIFPGSADRTFGGAVPESTRRSSSLQTRTTRRIGASMNFQKWRKHSRPAFRRHSKRNRDSKIAACCESTSAHTSEHRRGRRRCAAAGRRAVLRSRS